MDSWVPLIVAGIGVAGTISVALWNGRGESAALKQLTALNEAIPRLPEDAQSTKDLLAARDVLVERIASKLNGPRGWRLIVRAVGWILSALGAIIAGIGAFVWSVTGSPTDALDIFGLAAALLAAAPVLLSGSLLLEGPPTSRAPSSGAR